MADIYMPSDEAELSSFVGAAKAGNYPLEVCGFRSKREAGPSTRLRLCPRQSCPASRFTNPASL